MKVFTLIFVLLLSITSVAAITSVYESTTVSRIVGNTPEEMMRQLDRGDLDLKHAAYYGGSAGPGTQNKQLLASTFGIDYANIPTDNWIESTGQKLLVFDSTLANDKPDKSIITTGDVSSWSNSLDSQHSLVLMNSQYAGLSLPGINSFGTKVPPHAALIAPTAYKSQLFLKTLLCNIGSVSGLGKTFRQARNNYHWNIGETLFGSNELVGLTLISYTLYGNPFARVNVPAFDSAFRGSYCKDLTEDFETQSASTNYKITEADSGYTKTVTFTISENSIENIDNFELITTSDTDEQQIAGELVLPARVISSEFPLKTLITDVKLLSLSDPVEINANVPVWDGNNYVERQCYPNRASAEVDFSHAYSENSEVVLAHIRPIEIVDCNTGVFKLYTTVNYQITYYPFSPVRITAVDVDSNTLPGTLEIATVHLENTQNTPVTGQLALTDQAGNIVSIKDISTTQSAQILELPVPDAEGTYTYYAEFLQNEDSKTRFEFIVDVRVIESELDISGEESSANVNVHVHSNWQSDIISDVTVQLSHKGVPVDEKMQTVTIQPGDNDITFNFNGLKKEDGEYDVLAIVPYHGRDLTISGKIITNYVPAILNGAIVAKEGDSIKLTPEVIDTDNDALVTETSNAPFILDGTHTLSHEESGEYSVTVRSTDGVSTIERTIPIIVENVNREPDIDVSDIVQGKEGQELTVVAIAIDPDNHNSVENDDNELTLTYGPPLNANGKYTPGYDEQGDVITFVKVNDGELETTKLVTLNIENTNRAPTADVEDITIKEGESIDLWKGSDPDNENEVSDDDNILQFYFGGGPDGGPIDHFGRWQTDYDDSGVYPITVQVEDGELKSGKAITITVENVNRPPVISAPDVVYASGSVDLSQYVTDPDNTNSVATDDNALSITYTSPFDVNGRWTPAQPDSAAQVTITVSDGEFSATKTIMVMVDVVGVQPVQSPPAPTEEPEAQEEAQTPQESTTDTNDPSPPVQSTQTSSTPADPAPSTNSTPVQPQAQQTGSWSSQVQVQITQAETQQVLTSIQPEQKTETILPELEIKITVDGKQVDDGDSVKVKPGREFKVKVELENNAVEEKEVDVEVELDDFDQDDGDGVTLEPGENERLTFEFDVPRLTGDDEYPLEITVNDKKWNIKLKIDKPSHQIEISSQLEPETAPCEQTTSKLGIKLENTGKDDEEGTVQIESSTLKLLDEWPFDLPEGETQKFEKTINALIPGGHDISITANYGSRTAKAQERLTVEACIQEETVNTQIAPEERIALSLSDKKIAEPVSVDADFSETLTIVFVVLTGIFAVLLLAVFIPPLFKN